MKLKQLFKQTPSDLFWNFRAMCGYKHIMDLEGLTEVKLPPINEWGVGENWGGWWVTHHPKNDLCYWTHPLRHGNGVIFFPRLLPKVIDGKEIPYATGKINTYPFRQKYGYWEINCNISLQEALRHAFWG